MSADAQSLVAQTAANYGVDPTLALAVANAESNFNQSAVSGAGAIGVMQLMPATAAQFGVNPNDLTGNIQGGVQYLGQQLARFGDTAQALAAYNWGPANVARAVAAYGTDWLSHVPAQTRAYVARILGSATDSAVATATLMEGAPIESAAPAPVALEGGLLLAGLALAAYLILA